MRLIPTGAYGQRYDDTHVFSVFLFVLAGRLIISSTGLSSSSCTTVAADRGMRKLRRTLLAILTLVAIGLAIWFVLARLGEVEDETWARIQQEGLMRACMPLARLLILTSANPGQRAKSGTV